MSKKSVLVVASLAYDGIETPKNKVDYVLGGAGTYICLSLKNFSSEYSIVSVVGNDFKTEDLNLLENCGVDISGIKIEKNNKTFIGVVSTLIILKIELQQKQSLMLWRVLIQKSLKTNQVQIFFYLETFTLKFNYLQLIK